MSEVEQTKNKNKRNTEYYTCTIKNELLALQKVLDGDMDIFMYGGLQAFPITKQNQWREANTVVTFSQHGILNMKGQLHSGGRVALTSST